MHYDRNSFKYLIHLGRAVLFENSTENNEKGRRLVQQQQHTTGLICWLQLFIKSNRLKELW